MRIAKCSVYRSEWYNEESITKVGIELVWQLKIPREIEGRSPMNPPRVSIILPLKARTGKSGTRFAKYPKYQYLCITLRQKSLGHFKPKDFTETETSILNLYRNSPINNKNIAKGTTDRSVEFISKGYTQILIKFQFQNPHVLVPLYIVS